MAAAGKVEGGGAACGGASPGCTEPSAQPTAGDCPSCGHEYDCRERVPVRSTCTCGRLVCKSCEGAWVREGAARIMVCGLCGKGQEEAPDVKAHVGTTASDPAVDKGILATLAVLSSEVERCVRVRVWR